MMLEKTLESPLDCKEIKPVNPKGNRSWIFTGRTDAETETPILWPPDVKYWLIRKNPDAGRDWRQEEKGTTEDEMVGWHHRLRWTWGLSELWELVMDREAWRAAANWVTKSRTQLSKWTEGSFLAFTPLSIPVSNWPSAPTTCETASEWIYFSDLVLCHLPLSKLHQFKTFSLNCDDSLQLVYRHLLPASKLSPIGNPHSILKTHTHSFTLTISVSLSVFLFLSLCTFLFFISSLQFHKWHPNTYRIKTIAL